MSEPPKPRPSGRCGDLSPVSLQWLEQADPVSRKARGQYLTPRPVAEALIDRVGLQPGLRVLDPGVGTGELLRALLDREPDLEVTGWDTDPTAIRAAGELVPEARLKLRSALDPDAGSSTPAGSSGPDGTETGGFDLVIGNPPYFQLRLDPEERKRFAGVISGRPNIFALFFQIGLQELKPGGTLAFIVPPSMNSGAYFEALREYIAARAKITDLTILEGTGLFEGANTAIQLLVLRKNGPEEPVGRISGTGDGN
ncbi:MAG: N-6 DNA methylase, partial [Solirubrobacterales bacterium]|nr:N-6 DNA methylase [Solirubrobacterales bacterium]